jgi:hypothetical protein
MNSPAIERLSESPSFRNLAEIEFATHRDVWENEAQTGTGITGALGVAICVIGGDA